MRWEQARTLKDKDFQRLTGIPRPIVFDIIDVYSKATPRKGRKPRLSSEESVMVTLQYWRHYDVMALIGVEFGISEATVCRVIRRVEEALCDSDKFKIEGKKLYRKADQGIGWLLLTRPLSILKDRLKVRRITIVESTKDTG